jgi:hypothetical protein
MHFESHHLDMPKHLLALTEKISHKQNTYRVVLS